MKAKKGVKYAQILDGKCHWVFTAQDLPEWGDGIEAVEVDKDNPPSVGDEYIDGKFVKPAQPAIEELRGFAVSLIDSSVQAVYKRFTNLVKEYELRESEAVAYKDAGFDGDCGQQVSSYAESLGITNKQAAETVLAQAAGLRGALYALGVIRMRIKAVEKMTKKSEVEALKNTLLSEIAGIASQL